MVSYKKIVSYVLMLLCIVLYLLSPGHYSYIHNMVYLIIYVISLVFFFFYKKKKNYFDFDTLFLIANLFVHFIYPVFLYPIDPHFFVMFSFDFNQNLITRGTSLALCGLQAYICGSLSISSNSTKESISKIPYIPKNHLIPILVVTFLLFMINIDSSFYDGYSGGFSGITAYLLLFLVVLISVLVYSIFINKRFIGVFASNNKIVILISVFFILFSLYIGTRTYAIMFALLFVGLYSVYITPISKSKFLILVLVGCLSMSVIGMTRSGGDISIRGAADLIMDLVINCRSTYVALEYTMEHGLTYGSSLMGNILACVPFAQGIFVYLTGVHPRDISSSGFLTSLTLGYDSSLGLGTNIIADIFLAFGFIGVLIAMFYLGRLISRLMNNIYNNEYDSIIYFIFLSQCLYMARGEYFTPLRYILWGVITIWITRKIKAKSYQTKHQ